VSTIEAVLPWISSLDLGPLSRVSSTGVLADRAAGGPASGVVQARSRVGTCSLRQIVHGAVAHAEGEAIRRALTATVGNKSQAARLLGVAAALEHEVALELAGGAREHFGVAARKPLRAQRRKERPFVRRQHRLRVAARGERAHLGQPL